MGGQEFQSSERRRHFAPYSAPERHVKVAPPADFQRSDRYRKLEEQAKGFVHKQQFLREQAIEKDKRFKGHVAELRGRIEKLRQRIGMEAEERKEEEADFTEKFQRALCLAKESAGCELDASCAVVAEDWIPPLGARLDRWAKGFDFFVDLTIPETIENQSGQVTRHLVRAQETFNIDNTKLLKREVAIGTRLEKHLISTDQSSRRVEYKRGRAFADLKDEMDHEERLSDLAEEKHQASSLNRIRETQDMKKGLADLRARADSDILIGMEKAMTRLQHTIQANFGKGAIE